MFSSSALLLGAVDSSQRGVSSEVLGTFIIAVAELAGTCWLSIGMFGVCFCLFDSSSSNGSEVGVTLINGAAVTPDNDGPLKALDQFVR